MMRREEKEKREIKRLFLSSLSTFVSPIKKKLLFMWLVSTKFRLSVVSSVFFCCSFSTHRTFMSHVTCQSTTEFFHLRTFAKNTFFSFSIVEAAHSSNRNILNWQPTHATTHRRLGGSDTSRRHAHLMSANDVHPRVFAESTRAWPLRPSNISGHSPLPLAPSAQPPTGPSKCRPASCGPCQPWSCAPRSRSRRSMGGSRGPRRTPSGRS